MYSARQSFDRKLLGGIAIVGISFLLWIAFKTAMDTWMPVKVTLGETEFAATVARSQQAKERGLSGTDSLAEGTGMLFLYDEEDTWGIWMKDMRYSIDIIWMNNDKEIVYIVHNATPESYPKRTFKPNKPARYIIEVPAGTAKKHNIRVGDKAEFKV